MERLEFIEQTDRALRYIDALNHEVALLFREVEAALKPHEFILGRPSGYGITTRTSTGLDSQYVASWLPTSFTTFFVHKDQTRFSSGITHTLPTPDLRPLIMHIELARRPEPRILFGIIENIEIRHRKQQKFENYIGRIIQYSERIFANLPEVAFSDSAVSFTGKFQEAPLYDINNAAAIRKAIVEPLVEQW